MFSLNYIDKNYHFLISIFGDITSMSVEWTGFKVFAFLISWKAEGYNNHVSSGTTRKTVLDDNSKL